MTQLALTADPIDTAFAEYHQENPGTYTELVALAREWRAAGHDRIGIASLFEVLRWQRGISGRDADGFRLNNSYRANYARLILANEPDLAGVFEVRHLRRADEYVGAAS